MKSTGRAVLSVTAITLACRLFSLLSVQMYMSFYGTDSTDLNIFVYALKIPNLLFTALGTTLTSVVVPLYASALANNDDKRSKSFLDNIISITALILIVLVGIMMIAAPIFPQFSAYRHNAEEYRFAVYALRVLMPVMIFYGMTYIFQGMLQSKGRFLVPAAVSLPSSLTVIAYILLAGNDYGVKGLLFAMLIGLSLQAVFIIPSVIKTGYRYRPSFQFTNPQIITAAKMMPPVLAGVSAYQLNMLFNLSMSTHFGAVAILSYVQELLIVSVLSFIYSVTAVYFPRLTALWSVGDVAGYQDVLTETLSTALFFLIPLTVGFILLRYQVFDLLARWGNFDESNMYLAGDFMGLYALGIVAMGLKEILDKGFYSQKNTKISAIVGFMIMGVNIGFSLVFIRVLGVYALPLSYSVSSTSGVLVLIWVMRKKSGAFPVKLKTDTLKCLGAAAIMGAAVFAVVCIINRIPDADGLLQRSINLFAPVLTGMGVYFVTTYIFGVSYGRKLFSIFYKNARRV